MDRLLQNGITLLQWNLYKATYLHTGLRSQICDGDFDYADISVGQCVRGASLWH